MHLVQVGIWRISVGSALCLVVSCCNLRYDAEETDREMAQSGEAPKPLANLQAEADIIQTWAQSQK